MPLQDVAERGAYRLQGLVIQRRLRVRGRVPGRQRRFVALPQPQIQYLGQA
ncbi:hypothetical protein [Actinoplanes italicus]|uniref:hypothetical protein n=1 Tax=Actinoplanes italicus TaxID=113567 RepID=UPI001EF387B7|nr:hypothetical protein [Actinoplanes italicus]